MQNPYVRGTTVLPAAGRAYVDRTRARPGMVLPGGPVVRAFADVGWQWGGSFRCGPAGCCGTCRAVAATMDSVQLGRWVSHQIATHREPAFEHEQDRAHTKRCLTHRRDDDSLFRPRHQGELRLHHLNVPWHPRQTGAPPPLDDLFDRAGA